MIPSAAEVRLPPSIRFSEHAADVALVCAALGVLVVALSDNLAQDGDRLGRPLFWVGYLAIVTPLALAVIFGNHGRATEVTLLAALAVAVYLVKVLHEPTGFTFHDEFGHWGTADEITRSHHLFSHNPLLAVSPVYPGMEIVTAAITTLSGMSIATAGTIVVGLAKLVGVLGSYLLFSLVLSRRGAAIATVAYTANPGFTFFDSQFSYESVALPLAVVAFVAVSRCRRRDVWLAVAAVGGSAVVVTHHLTSYALVLSFVAAAVADGAPAPVRRALRHVPMWTPASRPRRAGRGSAGRPRVTRLDHALRSVRRWLPPSVPFSAPAVRSNIRQALPRVQARSDAGTPETGDLANWRVFAAFAFGTAAACTVWGTTVAPGIRTYLLPVLRGAASSVVAVLTRSHPARRPFQASAVESTPLWERVVTLTSVGMVVVGIVVGLVMLKRSARGAGLSVVLGILAVGYPIGLAFRLGRGGAELANRSTEFTYFGVAYLLALCALWVFSAARDPRRPLQARLGCGAAAALATGVLFIGGIDQGWSPAALQPGPYIPGANSRSITSQGISAAAWARRFLPSHSRVFTDKATALLMGSIGRLAPQLGYTQGLPLSRIMTSAKFDRIDRTIISTDALRYVVVDTRLSTAPPADGVYFYPSEPEAYDHRRPIPLRSLKKFSHARGLDKLFVNGPIAIYGTRRILNR